jgi:uncharacterized protein involved in outer membrane biogenesis
MTQDVHPGQIGAGDPGTGQAAGVRGRWRSRRWILPAAAALLLAVAVGPQMVNLNRYKDRIARLVATSLGRPVELSSVEMRLLPRPAFELSNLSVAEDPAYGVEPVLHANTVTASIRFLPLCLGRLEIGTISVDNASLNLVHSGPGKWNLDPLFRTAAAKAGSAENSAGARRAVRLPYLEASNSRINIKDGAEKLPFSLINTDFELWQESAGEWHIRLRGQPARTDVSLYQEDTGVVRLEADVGRAPALRDMPIHLDLDWRQAQLGQLARLVTGADPGWRGDLTGEVHVDGTANAAQVRTRLVATRVHRAEFAPAEPLDFDANCGFVYHYSRRALENLVCESPLGDGHIRVTGAMPHENQPPQLSFDLDRVPVAAGLDALRTLRSDVPEDLEAGGTVSGQIAFAPADAAAQKPAAPQGRARKGVQPAPGPLSGSLTVDDFALSGAGLNTPIQIAKIVLEPADGPADGKEKGADAAEALAGTVTLPAGGTAPLAAAFRLAREGYQVTLRGQANLQRARELFRAAGVAGPAGMEAIAGETLALDLHAEGPWLPLEAAPTETAAMGDGAAAPATDGALVDSLSGSVTVHDVNWKADFLAHPVEITQATLHLGNGEFRWDPVEFAYGPVKGTATLTVPVSCTEPEGCPPQFEMHFGSLDAATLETAALGVREKGTLLSDLIEKLHPESAPPWPQLEGSLSADALALGPVTLEQPQAELRIEATGAQITRLEAGLLGGKLEGKGEFDRAASEEDKPSYALDCELTGAQAQAVGRLLGETWSGGTLKAQGEVKLAGYTDGDLASSATGKVHFEWRHGAVTVKNSAGPEAPAMAGALRHFDLWTANAAIADGAITLGENKVMAGEHSQAIRGAVTFGNPPQVSLSAGNRTPAHTPAQAANGEQGTAGESAAGQNAADKDAAGKDADSPHPQQ